MELEFSQRYIDHSRPIRFWGQVFHASTFIDPKLRSLFAILPPRRYERRLRQVRQNLEDLARDLLIAKNLEEIEIHGCAIGSYNESEKAKDIVKVVSTTNEEEQGIGSKQSEKGKAIDPAIQPLGSSSDTIPTSNQEATRQSKGELLTEVEPEQYVDGSAVASLSFSHNVDAGQKSETSGKRTDAKGQRNLRVLPDSLVHAIRERAFPLANEGVTCEAFHALAAEAIWAGFNGSERVQKPPESVWEARGGDRWGAAAFFAERLGEREEEAVPGLPMSTILTTGNHLEDSSDDLGERPLSGSSARHAMAREVRLASASSRRGFLKQANDTAAQEVTVTFSCSKNYHRPDDLISVIVVHRMKNVALMSVLLLLPLLIIFHSHCLLIMNRHEITFARSLRRPRSLLRSGDARETKTPILSKLNQWLPSVIPSTPRRRGPLR